ncbi:MAG: hypothetical protein RIC80_20915 [Cyclobacteriaceae bacterium]
MTIKYTKSFLNKLEDIFSESDYILRYEKGNFHSGYCILNDNRIAIVNKYFPLDGKINALLEILKSIEVEPNKLSDKNRVFFQELLQTSLEI